MSKKTKGKGARKANSGDPQRLYPSPEFKAAIAELEKKPDVSRYVDCFLVAGNPVERDFLLERVPFQFAVDSIVSGDKHPLVALRSAWDALITYGRLIARIESPRLYNEPVAPIQPMPSVPATVPKELFDAITKMDDSRQEIERWVDEALEPTGYKHLPRRWSTAALAQNFDALEGDLGFSLFGDFDRHLSDLKNALPAKEKAVKPSLVAISDDLRRLIFGHWVALTDVFEKAWSAAKLQIATDLDCDKDENNVAKLAKLGELIARWNRLGGGIVILGPDFSERNEVDADASASPDADREKTDRSDITWEITERFRRDKEELCIPGVLDEAVGLLSLAHFNWATWRASDEINALVLGTLRTGPMLTQAIRERLLVLATDKSVDEDDEGAISIGACTYSGVRGSREIDRDLEGVGEIESIFESLRLEQSAISDEVFFAITAWWLDDFEETWLHRVTFSEGQHRLKRLFGNRSWPDQFPEEITSLEGLANCLGFTNEVPGPDVEASGIWVLAHLLELESWHLHQYDDRAKAFLDCTSRLLQDGLVATAGYVYCYFVVTEATEVLYRLKRAPEGRELNTFCPIGPWEKIHEVASRLSDHGWRERVNRTFAVSAEILRSEQLDSLEFALAQLQPLSGNSDLSVEGKEATAKIAQLVDAAPSMPMPLRDRIMEVMGVAAWDQLSKELQTELIRLERRNDIDLGDRAVFGGRTPQGAIGYVLIVERMFKEQLSGLWDLKIRHKAIDTFRTGSGVSEMPRRFTVPAAIYICKGAVEKGEATILDRLKEKGVDAHSVGGKFGEEIRNVLWTARNKLAHHESESVQEEAAESVRLWVLRNLPSVIESLGLGRKYQNQK